MGIFRILFAIVLSVMPDFLCYSVSFASDYSWLAISDFSPSARSTGSGGPFYMSLIPEVTASSSSSSSSVNQLRDFQLKRYHDSTKLSDAEESWHSSQKQVLVDSVGMIDNFYNSSGRVQKAPNVAKFIIHVSCAGIDFTMDWPHYIFLSGGLINGGNQDLQNFLNLGIRQSRYTLEKKIFGTVCSKIADDSNVLKNYKSAQKKAKLPDLEAVYRYWSQDFDRETSTPTPQFLLSLEEKIENIPRGLDIAHEILALRSESPALLDRGLGVYVSVRDYRGELSTQLPDDFYLREKISEFFDFRELLESSDSHGLSQLFKSVLTNSPSLFNDFTLSNKSINLLGSVFSNVVKYRVFDEDSNKKAKSLGLYDKRKKDRPLEHLNDLFIDNAFSLQFGDSEQAIILFFVYQMVTKDWPTISQSYGSSLGGLYETLKDDGDFAKLNLEVEYPSKSQLEKATDSLCSNTRISINIASRYEMCKNCQGTFAYEILMKKTFEKIILTQILRDFFKYTLPDKLKTGKPLKRFASIESLVGKFIREQYTPLSQSSSSSSSDVGGSASIAFPLTRLNVSGLFSYNQSNDEEPE